MGDYTPVEFNYLGPLAKSSTLLPDTTSSSKKTVLTMLQLVGLPME